VETVNLIPVNNTFEQFREGSQKLRALRERFIKQFLGVDDQPSEGRSPER
jgi:hypothetical protein